MEIEDVEKWFEEMVGYEPKWYDKQGNIITVEEFYSLGRGYRRVGNDEVDGYLVSTVLLGLDHSFGPGPPLIFETMVFLTLQGEVMEYDELYCDRYATEEEAIKGHQWACALIQAGLIRHKLPELTEGGSNGTDSLPSLRDRLLHALRRVVRWRRPLPTRALPPE